MNWITPGISDLDTYLAAPQREALQTQALAPGQSDPVAAILGNVVEQVRAQLRGSRQPVSATTGTVPPELVPSVAALTIERAQSRLPSLVLTADQKRAADQARELLALAGQGKLQLTRPDDPEEGLARASVLRSRETRLTSERLKGVTP